MASPSAPHTLADVMGDPTQRDAFLAFIGPPPPALAVLLSISSFKDGMGKLEDARAVAALASEYRAGLEFPHLAGDSPLCPVNMFKDLEVEVVSEVTATLLPPFLASRREAASTPPRNAMSGLSVGPLVAARLEALSINSSTTPSPVPSPKDLVRLRDKPRIFGLPVRRKQDKDMHAQLVAMGGVLKTTETKAGYLMKSGNRNKTWHRRWFILCPTCVGYFESDIDASPLGIFLASDVIGVIPDVSAELSLPFAFRVVASHRQYDMCACSSRDLARWVQAFRALMAANTPTSLAAAGPSPSTLGGGTDSPAPIEPARRGIASAEAQPPSAVTGTSIGTAAG